MKKITTLFFAMLMFLMVFACDSPAAEGEISIQIFRWDISTLSTAQRSKTPIMKAIKDKFNVNFDIRTAPSSNWEDSLNTLVNTQRIPDMFAFYGPDRPVQYKKWVSDGLLLPITDYVSETKYPNIHARFSEYEGVFTNLDFTNGKQYALPIASGKNDHTLYVRTDWIKVVNQRAKFTGEPDFSTQGGSRFNLDGPKTMEEFYWLCKAFSEQNPTNGAVSNTYGFSSSEKNMWFLNFAFYAFAEGGWNDRILVEDTQKYTESWISEGSKGALKFFNKLYNEGLMDPDFLTNTGDDKVEKFVTGQVGIIMHNAVSGYNYILKKFQAVNGGSSEMTYFAPPEGSGGAFGTQGFCGQRGGMGYYGFTGIKAGISAEKRERILSLLDYLLSDEGFELTTYGIEGTHFKVENEQIVNLITPDANGARNVRDADAGSLLKTFVDIGDNFIYPWDENHDILVALKEQTDSYGKLFAPLQYYNGSNLLTLGQTLNDFGVNSYGSMIVGKQSDFDSSWAAFVNSYLTNYNGQLVIDEYNAAVEALLS